jgi:hypothetical protein
VRLSLESPSWESSLLSVAGTASARRKGPGVLVPPGSENRAKAHEGSLGTWETRPSPLKIRLGTRNTNSPEPTAARRGRWEQTPDATVVSPREGNEAWRKGRTGVGAPHSTVEAGEPFRGTRRREGGAVS